MQTTGRRLPGVRALAMAGAAAVPRASLHALCLLGLSFSFLLGSQMNTRTDSTHMTALFSFSFFIVFCSLFEHLDYGNAKVEKKRNFVKTPMSKANCLPPLPLLEHHYYHHKKKIMLR